MPQKMHKRRLGNIIEKIKTRNLNDCKKQNGIPKWGWTTKWTNHVEIHYY